MCRSGAEHGTRKRPLMKQYDLVVLGAGSGNMVLGPAWR
jgi:hypothetical protein